MFLARAFGHFDHTGSNALDVDFLNSRDRLEALNILAAHDDEPVTVFVVVDYQAALSFDELCHGIQGS